MERYLDCIEQQYLGYPHILVADCKGRLNRAVLAQAYELLCQHYSVLRGRVRRDDERYLLHVRPDHKPELVEYDDGKVYPHLREAYLSWNPFDAVAGLMLIRGRDCDRVVFQADHAITDGRTRTAWFNELWHHYSALVNGSDVVVEVDKGLPASPYALFVERLGIERTSALLQQAGAPPKKRTDGVSRDGAKAVQGQIWLTAEDTARLVASARLHQISVGGLVFGAILVAQRTVARTPPEPTPMECWTVVDLRSHVHPAVGATETTDFLGLHRATVIVPNNASAVAVGREIKEQLDSAIARYELSSSAIGDFPRVDTSLDQRFARAFVSNLGITPPYPQPPGLTIARIWAYFYQASPFPSYGVSTYKGRLNINTVHAANSYTSDELEQLGKQVEVELRQTWASLR